MTQRRFVRFSASSALLASWRLHLVLRSGSEKGMMRSTGGPRCAARPIRIHAAGGGFRRRSGG